MGSSPLCLKLYIKQKHKGPRGRILIERVEEGIYKLAKQWGEDVTGHLAMALLLDTLHWLFGLCCVWWWRPCWSLCQSRRCLRFFFRDAMWIACEPSNRLNFASYMRKLFVGSRITHLASLCFFGVVVLHGGDIIASYTPPWGVQVKTLPYSRQAVVITIVVPLLEALLWRTFVW